MTLENSMFYFKSCFHSELFFHDVHDIHMRSQYLAKHLGDPQNKKKKIRVHVHVMILLTFYC